MTCKETFFHELRARGFRLTPQREMVLSVMHELEGLATAEEIFQRVHTLSSSVDISTVYRTLDLLQDFQLVTLVDAGDDQRRYELVAAHSLHLHLVCTGCGAVINAGAEPAETLAMALHEQYGFEADLLQLSVPGLCRACAASAFERQGQLLGQP